MFYRLIKPSWGKKKIRLDGGFVDNPDYIKTIKGKDVLEGCFDQEYVEEKNKQGYNVYIRNNDIVHIKQTLTTCINVKQD